ncbi:hypothetical protein HPB48_017632 [Haemaphysalis longicornis]|uniref:Uncharacterized protein n=1 Tax=Haemaphysalis longicornis TaxID=44386 RepID=A0A9J6GEF3_HAELO|nr:hypothetical protein HPB48_017632 [Haemaphysalis longicornis]
MIRSIRGAFRIYKERNPDSSIGLTKFYSLRPRSVKCSPQQEVCVCVYCANYELYVAAVENASNSKIDASGLITAFLGTPASDNCFLGECDKCPKGESLTLETLNIPEEEDIVVATWESGDLVKKTLDPSAFLRGLRVSLATWIVHNHIRKTQGAVIHNEKKCEQRGSVVFHFDFAENWTVILSRRGTKLPLA